MDEKKRELEPIKFNPTKVLIFLVIAMAGFIIGLGIAMDSVVTEYNNLRSDYQTCKSYLPPGVLEPTSYAIEYPQGMPEWRIKA